MRRFGYDTIRSDVLVDRSTAWCSPEHVSHRPPLCPDTSDHPRSQTPNAPNPRSYTCELRRRSCVREEAQLQVQSAARPPAERRELSRPQHVRRRAQQPAERRARRMRRATVPQHAQHGQQPAALRTAQLVLEAARVRRAALLVQRREARVESRERVLEARRVLREQHAPDHRALVRELPRAHARLVGAFHGGLGPLARVLEQREGEPRSRAIPQHAPQPRRLGSHRKRFFLTTRVYDAHCPRSCLQVSDINTDRARA